MTLGLMTRDELDQLAAEYVLGTLDVDSRAEVRLALATDLALQQAVDRWERHFAALLKIGEVEAPPPALWDGIEAEIDRSRQESYSVVVPAEEGEWVLLCRGVEKKSLFINREEGVEAFLLRFAPGAVLPGHAHAVTEECLVLKGDVEIDGLRLGEGDFHIISAGVPHPEISSRNGGLFYVRGELRMAS